MKILNAIIGIMALPFCLLFVLPMYGYYMAKGFLIGLANAEGE